MNLPFADLVGKAVVVGAPEKVALYKTITPAERPELTKAFAAAGEKASVVAAFLPTEAVRGLVGMSMPQLPPQLGGGPSTIISQGLRWLTISGDSPTAAMPRRAAVRLTIQAKDAEAAGKLNDLLAKAIEMGKQSAKEQSKKPEDAAAIDTLFSLLTPEVAGDRLKLNLDDTKTQKLFDVAMPQMVKARSGDAGSIDQQHAPDLDGRDHVYEREQRQTAAETARRHQEVRRKRQRRDDQEVVHQPAAP